MSNCIRESSNAAKPHSYGESFSADGRLGPSRLPITIRAIDRKSVVEGKRVSVRVDLGGRRSIKQKTEQQPTDDAEQGKERTRSTEPDHHNRANEQKKSKK